MADLKLLLAPGTGAATAEFDAILHRTEFQSVDGRADRAVTLFISGDIGAAEDIVVEYKDGNTWRDCVVDGNTLALNEDNTILAIYAPGKFRVNKPVTVNAVGVLIY